MGWVEGLLIPTRERCRVCWKVSAVGFLVPNEIWILAVPVHLREAPMCLPCFTSFADEKMIPWDRDIEFYPVSLRTHMEHCTDEGWLLLSREALEAVLTPK